jgi:hypothetical protein
MRHVGKSFGVDMSRQFASTALGLCLTAFAVTGADAQTASEPVLVVELYTSQGCSSCPAADDFLAELANSRNVVPLALHVDYWDYIGWADSFAKPAFTERQHSYARAAGSRMVYTPQMIVAGADRVEGNNPAKINGLIAAHLKAGHQVEMSIERIAGKIRIRAEPDAGLNGPVVVQLVEYKPKETVSIERGENAGQTIIYRNIVTDWRKVGEWSGRTPLDLTADVRGPGPYVAILQEMGPSAIIASARLE